MRPGQRLTLLFDEHDYLVRTPHPYLLQSALEHISGIGEVARNVQVVVVEVMTAEEALERSERDTIPSPAPVPTMAPEPVELDDDVIARAER